MWHVTNDRAYRLAHLFSHIEVVADESFVPNVRTREIRFKDLRTCLRCEASCFSKISDEFFWHLMLLHSTHERKNHHLPFACSRHALFCIFLPESRRLRWNSERVRNREWLSIL